MINTFDTILELSLTTVGFMAFFLFRSLVDEMRQVRHELHSLNAKISELLAKDQVLEHRLTVLERRGRNEN